MGSKSTNYKLQYASETHYRDLSIILHHWSLREPDFYFVSIDRKKVFAQRILVSFYSKTLLSLLSEYSPTEMPAITVPVSAAAITNLLRFLAAGAGISDSKANLNEVLEAAKFLDIPCADWAMEDVSLEVKTDPDPEISFRGPSNEMEESFGSEPDTDEEPDDVLYIKQVFPAEEMEITEEFVDRVKLAKRVGTTFMKNIDVKMEPEMIKEEVMDEIPEEPVKQKEYSRPKMSLSYYSNSPKRKLYSKTGGLPEELLTPNRKNSTNSNDNKTQKSCYDRMPTTGIPPNMFTERPNNGRKSPGNLNLCKSPDRTSGRNSPGDIYLSKTPEIISGRKSPGNNLARTPDMLSGHKSPDNHYYSRTPDRACHSGSNCHSCDEKRYVQQSIKTKKYLQMLKDKRKATFKAKKIGSIERFPCDKCDYVAARIGNLKTHKMTKHDGVKFLDQYVSDYFDQNKILLI